MFVRKDISPNKLQMEVSEGGERIWDGQSVDNHPFDYRVLSFVATVVSGFRNYHK